MDSHQLIAQAQNKIEYWSNYVYAHKDQDKFVRLRTIEDYYNLELFQLQGMNYRTLLSLVEDLDGIASF